MQTLSYHLLKNILTRKSDFSIALAKEEDVHALPC